ncbi:MAG TPA: VWA domain-containing protein [Vicinamibacterales bacterium]|nr:VWA domain-containing protein [Vicinamibacterales bacterium]
MRACRAEARARRRIVAVTASMWALSIATSGGQAAALRITAPTPDTAMSGLTRIEVKIEPDSAVSALRTMTISVDGRVACTLERRPLVCSYDSGEAIRAHHVRVVATLTDGTKLVDTVFTKDLGYSEHVRADAVLVPVLVTHGGQFVKGLKQQDFEIVEDGVKQTIGSLGSEDAPLDLVLAIDVSGSMEHALEDVKAAVKQLLSKLRPGDAATVIGFNDTMFLATEKEKDPKAREEAVDLLAPWGGTALYDATVSAIDLVSRDWGRKGIVIFSDGDDRNSITSRETATARVQASDAMLYTVGFGGGATVPGLKMKLEQYARDTGGRAFFPQRAEDLNRVFDEIVEELANQYVLSYSPTNQKQDDSWRKISVKVKNGKYDVRARDGYRVLGTKRTGR